MKIPLSQDRFTIIDDEDYELVKKYSWYCDNNRAVTNGRYVNGKRGKRILMHRLIMGVSDGVIIDHIDQNPLNNCRSNLRVTNKVLNGLNRGANKNNSSGIKGVHWHKRIGKWQSNIRFNGKWKHLGYFSSKEEAALVYQDTLSRVLDDGYEILTSHIEPFKKEA